MKETLYNKIGREYNATRTADPYIAERMHVLLNPKTLVEKNSESSVPLCRSRISAFPSRMMSLAPGFK